MTEPYFPADVSLRIEGNQEDAQQLYGSAANLLYKALELQRNGDKDNVRLLRPGTDGSLIQVALFGALKHVYVRPAPRTTPSTSEEVTPVVRPVVKEYINDMLSGVARPDGSDWPTVISITNPDDPLGPNVPALNQFHPDDTTAGAYGLVFDWQTPARLGVDDSGGGLAASIANCHYPKPCMYSGAMKRAVSAVLGVGRTTSETVGEISGELAPTYPDYVEWNQYDYTWFRTHGITKAVDGSVWLVEVSKLNGVLAMLLPIFDGTDEAGYLDWLAGFGDTDTMVIVFEFGGLPTGEPFPTGADLVNALTAGTVVRLASADDIKPFYHDDTTGRDRLPYFTNCGWAFADSGQKAINTCRWFSRPDIIGPPAVPFGYPYTRWAINGDASTRYFDQVILADGFRFADPFDRFMRTELWELTINVLRNPAGGGGGVPVGVGNATLAMVEQQFIAHEDDRSAFGFLSGGLELEDGFAYQWTLPPWWFPGGDTEVLDNNVRPFGRPAADIVTDTADWGASAGAPVYAFYVGEVREVVRYTPFYPGDGRASAPGYFKGTSLSLGDQSSSGGTGPFDTGTKFDIGLVVPAFTREAYALLKFTYPSVLGGADGDVQPTLFITDPVLIIEDLAPVALLNGGEVTFPGLTWLYGWCGYHPGDHRDVKCAASINTGPLTAYVVSDGVFDAADTLHYEQSVTLSPFVIPVDTPAMGVTFIGSVA